MDDTAEAGFDEPAPTHTPSPQAARSAAPREEAPREHARAPAPAAEPESEAATAEISMHAPPPAIEVDEDGWPKLDDEIPEERVPPELEPPTEEIPVLSPSAFQTPQDAQGARPAGRGRRGRDDRPHRDGEPRRPAAAAPRGAPSGPVPVLRPFDEDEDTRPAAAPRDDDRAPRRGEGRAALHFFHPERLDACQRAIGYHFRDISLLENALTHSSIKSDDRPSYERLEFLGDSVVGLVISEYLYNLLPDCDEGEMTKLKSIVVSTDGLANAAQACELERYLALGRGLLMKDEVPRSLIADVFEGVAGAVYLDRGYEAAELYVLDHLKPFVDAALHPERGEHNFKSVLQQVAQRDLGETPHYDTVRESSREYGPDHTRIFEVAAVLGRRRFPAARASTKKEAEQSAAKIALQVILHERGTGEISKPRRDHRHGGHGRGPRRGR